MVGNSCDKTRLAPVRPIKPTKRSVSGVFPFRGEGGIPYESTLERDFLLRTEFSSDVLAIISQPVSIPFTTNGRAYKYTPDFLVYYRLGDRHFEDYPKPMLVEVKPEADWRKSWRSWLPKWKAAWRHANEQGWAFHIHDESRIRDTALQNIKFLARYERMTFSPEDSAWIIESVREMGVAPVHYLLAKHSCTLYRGQGISHLWHLIATRRLACDIRLPLNEHLEVWVA
ncbi:MAG: heteromeric transposase endonuclease subunit TnsA [Pseudomonas sp.]|nr:heteromeric transposase endonuclease subunit TnsA [Pseudomonas sp.]